MVAEGLREQIQTAYRAWLDGMGRTPRQGQKMMIAAVARALAMDADDEVADVLVQADTGTGKTLAYALPGIVMARARDKTLVIATATTALQSQLVSRDLPDLKRHSGLDFSFRVAKGRRRYLCLSKLGLRLRAGRQIRDAEDAGLMDDFHHLDTAAFALLESMAAAFAAHEWDGDQDSLTEPVEPGVWRQVSTDHLQCAGRNCSNFRDCAYYQARQNWMEADVIVANHDLVLSDLSLGGGAVLPQPEDSLYIFDEGHHLPDKAVRQAHVSLRARGSQEASSRLARECERQCRQTESDWLRTGLTRLQAAIETLSGLQAELLADIQHWGDQLAGEGESSGEWQKTPLSVEQWQSLSIWGPGLTKALADVAGVLDDLREGEGDEKIRDPALQTWLGGVSRRAGQQLAFWQSLLRQPGEQAPPLARWIRVTPMYPDGQDIEINSCPVVAAEELRGWLWKRAAGVAVTSATLAAMGSFENWRRRCGLSSGAELIVPGPVGWDARVTLCVPMDFPDPRKADLHTLRMIEVLPTLMQLRAGTLVLFASARQMHEVYEGLAPEDQAQVLLQHQGQSKAQLVKTHCQQIDAGGSSTLFGLASLAEGVDLPGAYCEQVIIAKIPFAVPADPVARTLHNWIDASGGQSFMDISLPEAALRLRQACGRLVRSEQDGGLISILDSRLLNSGYGRKLLADLPGSDRLIRSLSDLPLADSVPEAS